MRDLAAKWTESSDVYVFAVQCFTTWILKHPSTNCKAGEIKEPYSSNDAKILQANSRGVLAADLHKSLALNCYSIRRGGTLRQSRVTL